MCLMCTGFFIAHLSRLPCALSERASACVWGVGESVMTGVRRTSGTWLVVLHVVFRLARIPTSSQEDEDCPPLSDCLRGCEPLCHSDPCCGLWAKPAARPAAKLMKFQKSVPVRSDAVLAALLLTLAFVFFYSQEAACWLSALDFFFLSQCGPIRRKVDSKQPGLHQTSSTLLTYFLKPALHSWTLHGHLNPQDTESNSRPCLIMVCRRGDEWWSGNINSQINHKERGWENCRRREYNSLCYDTKQQAGRRENIQNSGMGDRKMFKWKVNKAWQLA